MPLWELSKVKDIRKEDETDAANQKLGRSLKRKEKVSFYGYLTITPVLVVICLVLFFFNYRSGQQEKYASDYASVQTLAESMEIMQTDIRDFSTYISINNDIQNLLSRSDVTELNRNAKVWFDEAPMRIVQDMIALKGHIKTIAIYPENGLRPYLRGMDNSAYIPGIKIFTRQKSIRN